MDRPLAKRPYHHGDLKVALTEEAAVLIEEQGLKGFSLAELSRRLGVASSAPYAHFKDRDALIAAVAVRAYERLLVAVEEEIRNVRDPGERLAAIARVYVRFAGEHPALFELLFSGQLDKGRHPEIAEAERPLEEIFTGAIRGLDRRRDDQVVEALTICLEASAYGHALLLVEATPDPSAGAVASAADRAGRAALALIRGRKMLADHGGPS